jgi:tetratricopeptide (TPR) repeat protein/TolB-like protein
MIGTSLSHYRVLEQIGAGGMGVVFRAHDQQLERDVAIKILPAGMLSDETAHRRFRREALVLAKLNHPNIGVVYEFGNQDGTDFLVMELVSGVSLDHKLLGGPLPQKEVLRLGVQLADGLVAAHEQGVIHRDLKPANLRLTPDGRLKILDFGLAQLTRHEQDVGLTTSLGERAGVTGTLPYMAPEQLRGETSDTRGDIWSAGAVLYEMATGRRPFPERHLPMLIDAILNQEPEPPAALNPKISPGLEYLILKCLDKDPERRYQSVRELRVDLERLTAPISAVPSARMTSSASAAQVANAVTVAAAHAGTEESKRKEQDTRRRRAKVVLISAALIMLALSAAVIFRFLSARSTRTIIESLRARRSVAVLGIKNLTGQPQSAWLSTALAEMLTTEVGAGEKLRMISGEDVAHMRLDLAPRESDTLGSSTLAHIGKNLGADLVISGSYVALSGGQIRLDLRLQDVATGEVLASVPETGDEGTLFDLVSRAGARLREKCGAGKISPNEQAAVKASLPSGTEATRLYSEGVARLRVFDARGARDLLEKAVAAEPNFALAHSALAAAWSALGYDEKARQYAKNAFDLSAELPREDKLLIEARYREHSKEWNSAAGIYRTLFGFFPDNLDYGILLVNSQNNGGHAKDALSTIDSLRRLPAPSRDDPRISLSAAETSQALGDFQQMLTFAAEGAQKAGARGSKLVLARALYLEASAHENLSHAKEATAAAEEARKIYAAVGDLKGVASTLEVFATVLADQGNLTAAFGKYKEELAIARELGNRRGESSALNNMALVLDEQGDREAARGFWQQALSGFQDISDKGNSVRTLVNIGGVFKDEGDHAMAKKTYEQALAVAREINDQDGISLALASIGTVLDAQGHGSDARKMLDDVLAMDTAGGQPNPAVDKLIDLGDVLQHLGDLGGASGHYQDALRLAQAAGDKSMTAYTLMGLGSLALKAGQLPEARKNYEQALALRKELGEKDSIAQTQVALSELLLEEGHASEAEAAVRPARDHLRSVGLKDDETSATVVLVRTMLAQNKVSDAARELAQMDVAASKRQNLAVKLDFEIANAQAGIAGGKLTAARKRLGSVLAQDAKAGLTGQQFEARLALGELERKAGNVQGSRAQLEQLETEATNKGFLLIAKKAAAQASMSGS